MFTIKEFMDHMDSSTESKCQVYEKETNNLLFSGSMWEIPTHYQNRQCSFILPIDFSTGVIFLVEPFNLENMMEVVCLKPCEYDFTEKDETYYFDRRTIFIDGEGGVYGHLFASNGKALGSSKLSRFMTTRM